MFLMFRQFIRSTIFVDSAECPPESGRIRPVFAANCRTCSRGNRSSAKRFSLANDCSPRTPPPRSRDGWSELALFYTERWNSQSNIRGIFPFHCMISSLEWADYFYEQCFFPCLIRTCILLFHDMVLTMIYFNCFEFWGAMLCRRHSCLGSTFQLIAVDLTFRAEFAANDCPPDKLLMFLVLILCNMIR